MLYKSGTRLKYILCGFILTVCLIGQSVVVTGQTALAEGLSHSWADVVRQSGNVPLQDDSEQIVINDVQTRTSNSTEILDLPVLELKIVFSILQSGFAVHDRIKKSNFIYSNANFLESSEIIQDNGQTAAVLLVDSNISSDQAKGAYAWWGNLNNLGSDAMQPDLFVMSTGLDQFRGAQEDQFLVQLRESADQQLCLYDGIFHAVDRVANSGKPRKAVFVLVNRQDAGCGITWRGVVDYAKDKHTQVFALTIPGTEALRDWDGDGVPDVRNLTEFTGGVTLSTDNVSDGLKELAAVLNNQYKVTVRLCPVSGAQNLTLNLELENGTKIAKQIPFVADRAYSCPLQPKIDALSTNTMMGVNLKIPGLPGAAKVNLELINSDRQQTVRQLKSINVTSEMLLVLFPRTGTPELIPGTAYTLTVVPAADNGASSLVPIEKKFDYEPDEAKLNIEAAQQIPVTDQVIAVSVKPYNFALQGMDVYQVKVKVMQGNQVAWPPQVLSTNPKEATITTTLPVEGLNAGDYTVHVEALTRDGQSLAIGEGTLTYHRPAVWEYASVRNGLLVFGTLAGLGAIFWSGLRGGAPLL